MHEEEMYVSISDCDESGSMNIASVLSFFQNIVDRHDFGYPLTKQIEMNILWVLVSWRIDVKRFPICREKVKVRTYLNVNEIFFSRRTFSMIDENGEVIATAAGNLALCNRATGRPTRMTPEYASVFEIDEEYACELSELSDKDKHEGFEECGQFKVMRHDLDLNKHMNNISSIRNTLDFLDADFVPKHLHIYYGIPAFLNDNITAYKTEEDGKIVVELKKDDKNVATLIFE